MLLCVLPKMMPCSIYLRSWILDLTSLSACECSSNRVRKPRKTGFVLPLSEVEHVFLCLQPPSWIANWGLVGLLRSFELEIGLERSRWKKLSLGNGNFNFLLLLNCFLLECYQITRQGTSSLNQHSVWIPPSAEVTQMTVVNGCG